MPEVLHLGTSFDLCIRYSMDLQVYGFVALQLHGFTGL